MVISYVASMQAGLNFTFYSSCCSLFPQVMIITEVNFCSYTENLPAPDKLGTSARELQVLFLALLNTGASIFQLLYSAKI